MTTLFPSNALLALSLVAVAGIAAAQTGSRITEVGTLGRYSAGLRVNNAGQVVGQSELAYATWTHAFIWSDGVITDIGTLGGYNSQAEAINDKGQVTGSAADESNGYSRAFLWSDGVMQDIGTLGGTGSGGAGINEAGQITGLASVPGDLARHAFIWEEGSMTDLGSLGGSTSVGVDINNTGQVAGWSSLAGDANYHGFYWDGERMHDIGTLGGLNSYALGINDAGQVAGEGDMADGTWRGFVWERGTFRVLETAAGYQESSAHSINHSGVAVGSVWQTEPPYDEQAAIWCNGRAHRLIDLVDPADPLRPYVTLRYAMDINDGGQILINGYDDRIADSFEGARPFVLSPVTCPYAFEGYFSPVDNLPVRNGVQAGRAIPVKFSLGGDQGLDIFAAGYPTAQRIDCDTATALAPVEETVTAGASSLSYSSGTDQYHYVWKTEKAWAGTCQQLTIRLNDHSEHSANFQFR